jgi:hypothetical protein
VTLNAADRRVLSEQRVFRLRVIEALADGLQRDLLPPAGVMTSLAALREAATMRVGMTIGTQ